MAKWRSADVGALLEELGIETHRCGREERRGLCPSPKHDDRAPSWMVRVGGEKAGLHHCFSCGFGGGLPELVAAARGLSKREAWEWLRARFGGSVPDGARASRFKRKVEAGRSGLRLRYPRGTIALWRDPPPEVHPALEYVLSRGLTETEIELYAIGAVPEATRGYGGRVIVPVVVGAEMVDFVARLFVERRLASKALSAKKELGARKELALWRYDLLEPELPVVVCEGVWGAIALLHAGVPNVVAACGSAWSDERTQLLERWDRIVLVPDGDAAGSKLVHHASSLRFNHDLRVVDLGGGRQPDDVPGSELRALVQGAETPSYGSVPPPSISSWTGKR